MDARWARMPTFSKKILLMTCITANNLIVTRDSVIIQIPDLSNKEFSPNDGGLSGLIIIDFCRFFNIPH